jgi:hypothetical protein
MQANSPRERSQKVDAMPGGQKKIDITPETKVGALLECYPQLEDLLIELAPAFAKLKNPVLRKTVAKVATLRQAAKVGGVNLSTLINKLRQAVGAKEIGALDENDGSTLGERPDWCRPENVTESLDARQMIKDGEQPIGSVLQHLDRLPKGKVFELITPFVPAPLVDIARSKTFEVWWQKEDEEIVRTYFHR